MEGVVDLAFEERGEWTVVDYKTDREIAADGEERYKRQVAFYARAIAEATGQAGAWVLSASVGRKGRKGKASAVLPLPAFPAPPAFPASAKDRVAQAGCRQHLLGLAARRLVRLHDRRGLGDAHIDEMPDLGGASPRRSIRVPIADRCRGTAALSPATAAARRRAEERCRPARSP